MATVHLGIAQGADLANAITGLGASLDQLATKQRSQTQATRQQTTASTAAAAGLQSFAQSAQNGIQRVQGIAGAIQGLVSQLGSSNRTAGLVASVAGATAQFAAMGSMLGPAGTVAGGIAGLITGLISVTNEMNDVEAAARAAATEVHNLATANIAARAEAGITHGIITGAAGDIGESDLTMRGEEARIRARAAEEEIARRSAALSATVTGSHGITGSVLTGGAREDAEAALAAARETLRAENAIVDGVRREVDAREDARREAEHMAELQRTEADTLATEERDRAAAAEATAALDARNREARARHGGGRRASADSFDENAFLDSTFAMAEAEAARRQAEEMATAAAEMERIRAEDEASFEEWAANRTESLNALKERNVEAAEAARETQRALFTESTEAYAAFSDSSVRSIDAIVESWREYNDTAKAAGVQTLSTSRLMTRSLSVTADNITDSVGNKMTGAFSEAVGAWLDGSKSFVEAAEGMAKGVVKALTQEAIVQTVVELARSIASFASQDYAGGIAHAGAAAAWAAVGVVAGSVGAATGAFGGGGKSEGATSRDMADRDRERSDAPPGNTVVNIHMDGVPVTQSEVGAGVFRGLRSAQRHGYLPAGALTR